MSKVWLVTGASRGLGRAVAEAAAARNDTVVAAARNAAAVSDFDHALTMDVTEPASVERGVAEAMERHGRIDVLVNNAGHGLVGALEELTEDELRSVLDTNVLGVFRVTRAVLPHMRDRRGGHIVQMSSVGGVVGNPGHAAYATSKFALEGMSEALAAEVAPFGIKVTIVEPGPFRTDFAGTSMRYATPIDHYVGTPAGDLRKFFADQDGRQPNDPALAAQVILRAIDDDSSPLRLPAGPEAVDRIRSKLTAQLDDLEQWADVSVATRYQE